MQIGVPTAGRMWTEKSANQQRRVPLSNLRAGLEPGSARRTGIVERIAPRSAPRSYGSICDRGPSSTRDEQRWASVSEREIWTNPLVLPTLLCGAAAGDCAHRYIGKACCLLLVRADYIRPRPLARPRGHWESLKLLRWLAPSSASGLCFFSPNLLLPPYSVGLSFSFFAGAIQSSSVSFLCSNFKTYLPRPREPQTLNSIELMFYPNWQIIWFDNLFAVSTSSASVMVWRRADVPFSNEIYGTVLARSLLSNATATLSRPSHRPFPSHGSSSD